MKKILRKADFHTDEFHGFETLPVSTGGRSSSSKRNGVNPGDSISCIRRSNSTKSSSSIFCVDMNFKVLYARLYRPDINAKQIDDTGQNIHASHNFSNK